MENNTMSLHSFALPAIREAKGDTIFNPANFLAIYDRVIKINPGAQRQWGKMNVVQMLNHLKIATGSGINEYQLKDESTFLWRTIIKFIALVVLKRFPKGAKAAEGFKIEMNNALDFNTEKEQALIILKKAYASTYDTYPHPLFGIMSRKLWGKLIYRHFDHHLRQFNS
ncbi:MAG TPA: DUF1569 domain-containing protein [Chitinophagaceae bacterium]